MTTWSGSWTAWRRTAGTLRLLGGTGRADDGDEAPELESDPGMGAASYVLGLAHARGPDGHPRRGLSSTAT